MKVDLPKDQVEKCRTPDNRDVYRVPGKDLKLNPQMKPEFGKTGGKK